MWLMPHDCAGPAVLDWLVWHYVSRPGGPFTIAVMANDGNIQMKQATMVCAVAVLLAVVGVMHKLTEPAPPQYAFEIPAMVLQCIDFPVPDQSDWTVPSFKFEQAVRFNFLDFKGTIRMPGSYQLSACDLNFPTKAPIRHVTFGSGGAVTIER